MTFDYWTITRAILTIILAVIVWILLVGGA